MKHSSHVNFGLGKIFPDNVTQKPNGEWIHRISWLDYFHSNRFPLDNSRIDEILNTVKIDYEDLKLWKYEKKYIYDEAINESFPSYVIDTMDLPLSFFRDVIKACYCVVYFAKGNNLSIMVSGRDGFHLSSVLYAVGAKKVEFHPLLSRRTMFDYFPDNDIKSNVLFFDTGFVGSIPKQILFNANNCNCTNPWCNSKHYKWKIFLLSKDVEASSISYDYGISRDYVISFEHLAKFHRSGSWEMTNCEEVVAWYANDLLIQKIICEILHGVL